MYTLLQSSSAIFSRPSASVVSGELSDLFTHTRFRIFQRGRGDAALTYLTMSSTLPELSEVHT